MENILNDKSLTDTVVSTEVGTNFPWMIVYQFLVFNAIYCDLVP